VQRYSLRESLLDPFLKDAFDVKATAGNVHGSQNEAHYHSNVNPVKHSRTRLKESYIVDPFRNDTDAAELEPTFECILHEEGKYAQ